MKKRLVKPSITQRLFLPAGLGACVGGALITAVPVPQAHAQSEAKRLEMLEKENLELKRRLDSLEVLAKKEGIMPTGEAPKTMPLSALSAINISGFVQASYFYNTQEPPDGKSDAYLWNASHNSFSLNKFKLTLASPAVATDKWDAGYRVSLLWGEDAPNLNTGTSDPGLDNIREAYVEMNAPLGSGLNMKAGQLISLLNWESGDGGAANPNFSQGNQWWFTGNGPSAGVQLGYAFTEKIDLKARIQNGMFAGPVDENEAKAYVASLGVKPIDRLWANLIGWYSHENDTTIVSGASVIGGFQVTPALGTGFEFDYFHFDNEGMSDDDLWSIGGWVWYDLNSKVGLALRADFIDSPDFTLGPPVRPGAQIGSLLPFSDTSGDLASLTLTLNYKPVPNLKIQPEIRYDHTSYKNGLDGQEDRVTIGAGISYLF